MKRAQYLSQARFLHNPLHPFLAHIPFAAGLAVLALDIAVYAGSPASLLQMVSLWTLVSGAGFALLAAITGAVDVRYELPGDSFPRARRTASLHALLMTLFIVLIVVSIAIRLADRTPLSLSTTAFVASTAGTLIMLYSSYLGGKLVFVHGIRVDGGEGVHLQKSEDPAGPLPPNVHRFPGPRLHLRRKHKEGEE